MVQREMHYIKKITSKWVSKSVQNQVHAISRKATLKKGIFKEVTM